MTVAELHAILDNKDRVLSFKELCDIIYELKQDVYTELCKATLSNSTRIIETARKIGFYDGEQNAFQIVLDLLEHCQPNE